MKLEETKVTVACDMEYIEQGDRTRVLELHIRVNLKVIKGEGLEALCLKQELEQWLEDKINDRKT